MIFTNNNQYYTLVEEYTISALKSCWLIKNFEVRQRTTVPKNTLYFDLQNATVEQMVCRGSARVYFFIILIVSRSREFDARCT